MDAAPSAAPSGAEAEGPRTREMGRDPAELTSDSAGSNVSDDEWEEF
ncbi:MAG: hypothetical protein GY725_22320 [bacterium]|nr:hypothetical protein [bacterium]